MCEYFHFPVEQLKLINAINKKVKSSPENPKLKIEPIELSPTKIFNLVQEGYLIAGTKQRVSTAFIKYMLKQNPKIDTLLYGGTANGFGPVATAYAAYKLGLHSHVFLAGVPSERNTRQINTLMALNSEITICKTYREAREMEYKKSDEPSKGKWKTKENVFILPMGLNDDNGIMIDLLSNQLRKASSDTLLGVSAGENIRIWLVSGSGGIAQSLLKAFPNCKLCIVLTGGGVYIKNVEKWAKTLPNSVKIFNRDPALEQKSDISKYYSSVNNYDDIVWPYVKKYGKNGDFIWNVSCDDYLFL
jgi:hypothetical protein